MSKHTYMREVVPHTNNGTCPCCLKQHRITKRGVVTRHGWNETGRQVGQWGQGFQWGECNGWGKRPLEMTDADAQEILVALERHMQKISEDITLHEGKGADSYTQTLKFKVYSFGVKLEGFLKALQESGVEFTHKQIPEKLQGHRVYYEPREVFTLTIPRGSAYKMIPESAATGNPYDNRKPLIEIKSWEDLRGKHVFLLQETLVGLQRSHEQIRKAVEYHRDNPSNGIPVVTSGPVFHYQGERLRKVYDRKTGGAVEKMVSYIACQTKAFHKLTTSNKEEVTCKRCLAKLAK